MVRRLIRDLSSVLILSGLLLVLDAGVTLIWQEPVTAAIGLVMRGEVNQRYLSYHTAPLSTTDVHALRDIQTLDQRLLAEQTVAVGGVEHAFQPESGIARAQHRRSFPRSAVGVHPNQDRRTRRRKWVPWGPAAWSRSPMG